MNPFFPEKSGKFLKIPKKHENPVKNARFRAFSAYFERVWACFERVYPVEKTAG